MGWVLAAARVWCQRTQVVKIFLLRTRMQAFEVVF